MLLLLLISLYGTKEERSSRGWVRPCLQDIPAILIFLILMGILSLVFQTSKSTYSVSLSGIKGIILLVLFAFSVSISEELFFRSWLISGLKALRWPSWAVFTLPVVFFTSLHLWEGWRGLIFAGIFGAVFTLFFMRTPRLLPLIAAHGIYNALALYLMSTQ